MVVDSLGALLVVAIFLPQLLLQLRISFLHRRLAQLARHDVIVAAVADIRRYMRWPVVDSAGTATNTSTAARAIPTCACSACSARRAARCSATAGGSRATLRAARSTAARLTTRGRRRIPLLVQRILLALDAAIEYQERFIDLAIDRRTLLVASGRPTTGVACTARAGTCRCARSGLCIAACSRTGACRRTSTSSSTSTSV